jgi:hypothetical protein
MRLAKFRMVLVLKNRSRTAVLAGKSEIEFRFWRENQKSDFFCPCHVSTLAQKIILSFLTPPFWGGVATFFITEKTYTI